MATPTTTLEERIATLEEKFEDLDDFVSHQIGTALFGEAFVPDEDGDDAHASPRAAEGLHGLVETLPRLVRGE